jgi:phenylacetic acid degradation operon negative regulatory protein
MRHDDRVSPATGPATGPAIGAEADAVQLRPLTARSAILSLLLGTHPPSATVSDLVAFGRQLDINESAVRAALTRMVTSGDLLRDNGTYTLPARLLERQRRQDESMQVPTEPWDGTWRVAAVVSSGKDPASRLNLRRSMLAAHFGELREGLWLRPDNLPWHPAAEIADDLQLLRARPDHDAADLAHHLFHADRWARVGRGLLAYAGRSTSPRDRLTVFATIVRHLTHDPLLPAVLLPDDWPGTALRETYDAFREEVVREWRRT